MPALGFLLLELSPLLVFEFDFVSALSHEYPLVYFDDTCQKCRTGPDDVLCTRMTTGVLLLNLSPLRVF